MRNTFVNHYRPTSEEMKALWEDGLIVLDTNVLLSLYRMPTSTRDELLGLLEELKDRIWIPFHVGLEFQRARLKVIGTEQKDAAKAEGAADQAFSSVINSVKLLQVDKRGIDLSEKDLLDQLSATRASILDAIGKVSKQQLSASHEDTIRDRIDAIIGDHVGDRPADQEAIATLTREGESRYAAKIPPGFLDTDKERNPEDAEFWSDGLKYPRKFGDLILWRQVIDYVRHVERRKVLLITSDVKEDWWIRNEGKTIGPQPELVSEIRREAGVQTFWMYTLVQFMEQASKHVKTKISAEAIKEVKESATRALERAVEETRLMAEELRESVRNINYHSNIDTSMIAKASIRTWLRERGEEPIASGVEFPSIITEDSSGRNGHHIYRATMWQSVTRTASLRHTVLRAGKLLDAGDLVEFTVYIVINDPKFNDARGSEDRLALAESLHRLSKFDPRVLIIAGIMARNKFEPIIGVGGPFSLPDADEE